MTIVEHDRAALQAAWLPERASARRFYEPGAIVTRLERLAGSRYSSVAAAASEPLGTS